MYLIRGVWPSSWREQAVGQGQVIAPQLELVELNCDWTPRDGACCRCRRCTHLLLPGGKHNYCLQEAQLLSFQGSWCLKILFNLRQEAGVMWPAGPRRLKPLEGQCHLLGFWKPLRMWEDTTGSKCQPDFPTVHDGLRVEIAWLAVNTETTCAFKLQM